MTWIDPSLGAIKKDHIIEIRDVIDALKEEIGTVIANAFKVYRNVINLSEATTFVNIGINEYKKATGTLMVFQNSVLITEGVDYTISQDSRTITIVEGEWEVPTEIQFVVFTTSSGGAINRSVVTTDGPASTVRIGINSFIKEEHTLLVFKNSALLTENVDYSITPDSEYIQCLNGEWVKPSQFNYMTFK